MIQCRDHTPHRPCIVAGEAPSARQNEAVMVTALMVLKGSELAVIDGILRDHGAFFCLGQNEDHGIRLAAEVGPLCDRCHLIAPESKLNRKIRWPHLIEEELHARRKSCRCCQPASARAVSSSTRRIQSSISSGKSA